MKPEPFSGNSLPSPGWRTVQGFTLIEIMVVVAVIAVIVGAGVPSLYGLLHKEGFRKTMSDLTEVCQAARSRAILRGVPVQLMFYPHDNRCEVSGGAVPGWSGGLATSARLNEGTIIEMLDINLQERKDDEVAHVTFYPEGTCDEMLLILRSERNEQRGITLEITTGLVSVLNEEDLQKLRNGRL